MPEMPRVPRLSRNRLRIRASESLNADYHCIGGRNQSGPAA